MKLLYVRQQRVEIGSLADMNKIMEMGYNGNSPLKRIIADRILGLVQWKFLTILVNYFDKLHKQLKFTVNASDIYPF